MLPDCLQPRCLTLEQVAKISRESGRPLPKHLVIQSDNTTAQAKNKDVMMFLAFLVACGKPVP